MTSGDAPLAPLAPLFAGVFELLIALLPDESGASFEDVVGRTIPESAVEANAIVMVDKSCDNAPSLVESSGESYRI